MTTYLNLFQSTGFIEQLLNEPWEKSDNVKRLLDGGRNLKELEEIVSDLSDRIPTLKEMSSVVDKVQFICESIFPEKYRRPPLEDLLSTIKAVYYPLRNLEQVVRAKGAPDLIMERISSILSRTVARCTIDMFNLDYDPKNKQEFYSKNNRCIRNSYFNRNNPMIAFEFFIDLFEVTQTIRHLPLFPPPPSPPPILSRKEFLKTLEAVGKKEGEEGIGSYDEYSIGLEQEFLRSQQAYLQLIQYYNEQVILKKEQYYHFVPGVINRRVPFCIPSDLVHNRKWMFESETFKNWRFYYHAQSHSILGLPIPADLKVDVNDTDILTFLDFNPAVLERIKNAEELTRDSQKCNFGPLQNIFSTNPYLYKSVFVDGHSSKDIPFPEYGNFYDFCYFLDRVQKTQILTLIGCYATRHQYSNYFRNLILTRCASEDDVNLYASKMFDFLSDVSALANCGRANLRYILALKTAKYYFKYYSLENPYRRPANEGFPKGTDIYWNSPGFPRLKYSDSVFETVRTLDGHLPKRRFFKQVVKKLIEAPVLIDPHKPVPPLPVFVPTSPIVKEVVEELYFPISPDLGDEEGWEFGFANHPKEVIKE